MDYLVIKNKTTEKVVAAGYTNPPEFASGEPVTVDGKFTCGLGSFSAEKYEVELHPAPPPDMEFEPEQPIRVELESMLVQSLSLILGELSPGQQIDIFNLKATLKEAAKFLPDLQFALGAKEKIQSLDLPPSVDAIKESMIDFLDEKIAELS